MGNLIRSAAGALLFAAALALSLPGTSVRADAPDSAASSAAKDAPMCRADSPGADPAEAQRVVDAVRRQAAQAPAEDAPRMLNGYGYNYAANRGTDFQVLQREMLMERSGSH